MKGLECPRNDFLERLGVVGKLNRRCRSRRGLLSDVFRENRCAVPALREGDATGQTRHARADDCDRSTHFQMVGTDRRAVRKIL